MANKRIKDLPAFSGTLPNNAAFAIDAGQATQKVEFSTLKNAVAPIGTKSITANGTYPASGDSLYGYSEVEVDVPNTYVTGDAGKVVQDGALVSQTSRTVTQNGTYNTTTNNQVLVNVPQPLVGTKSITANGTYNSSSDDLAGYSQVNVNVPDSATLIAKSITQNGTYNASVDNADGYSSVTVNVSGGGGDIPLMTDLEWYNLSIAQKQTYGYVAIQTENRGYVRGKLVYGAEYVGDIVQSGTASGTQNIVATTSGRFKLFVLVMNSEASTFQLDITVTLNNTAVSGETLEYTAYSGSGTNRRNHRLAIFDVTTSVGDAITINVNNRSSYTSYVWAIIGTDYSTLDKSLTSVDSATSGANTINGMVMYGTFNSGYGGTMFVERYIVGTTITTADPGSGYRSSYIFWFTETT